MKKLLTCLVVLWAAYLLSCPAAALTTYTDDFADNASNNIKTYNNLIPFQYDADYWLQKRDQTAFTFGSTSPPTGWAVYQVRNAYSVTVGLYTRGGAFYMKDPDKDEWYLGPYTGDISKIPTGGLPQASYSHSAKNVYADIGGVLHQAYDRGGNRVFAPATTPPGALVGYGVNVYVSADGQSWTWIALTQTALSPDTKIFTYEEYTGAVPSWTRYVRVELNDFNRMERMEDRGSYVQKAYNAYNLLASVSFAGVNLWLGAPEPLAPEYVLPGEEEQSSGSASSSSRASSSRASSSRASGSSAASSTPYSGPKFEGVLESSAPSRRASSSKAPSSAAPVKSSAAAAVPQAAESVDEVYRHVQDDTIYQIPSKSSDDISFTVGVTAYIIIVVACIAFGVTRIASKRSGR